VSHSNRISTVDVISKNDALEFLDLNDAHDNNNAAGTNAPPTPPPVPERAGTKRARAV